MLGRLLPSFLPVPYHALVHAHRESERHLTNASDCAKRLQPITKRASAGKEHTGHKSPLSLTLPHRAHRKRHFGRICLAVRKLMPMRSAIFLTESPWLSSSKSLWRSFSPIRLPWGIGSSRSELALLVP